jgi:hypothetical protein
MRLHLNSEGFQWEATIAPQTIQTFWRRKCSSLVQHVLDMSKDQGLISSTTQIIFSNYSFQLFYFGGGRTGGCTDLPLKPCLQSILGFR